MLKYQTTVKPATFDTKSQDRPQDLESHLTGEGHLASEKRLVVYFYERQLCNSQSCFQKRNGLELNEERTPGLVFGFTAV